jgi:hypothetical protein
VGRESKTLSQKTNPLNYLLQNKIWFIVAVMLTVTVFAVWGGINNTNISQGVTNSGTNLPIGKGGTGAGTAPQALKNLLPPFNADPGKVLGLDDNSDPIWVNNTNTSDGMVPDYANMENINRIPTVSSTWTVDRVGFVRLYGYYNGAIYGSSNFRINGQNVLSVRNVTGSNGNSDDVVVPVKIGDVISVVVNTGVSPTTTECWFIPPVFIEQEAPVIVSPGVSYSAQEVATGETWIDGKPIYRRTFTGNIVAAANTQADTVLIDSGIQKIVSSGGSVQLGSPTWGMLGLSAVGGTICSQVNVSASNSLRLTTLATSARAGNTDNAYEVWVEYTKL